MSSEITTTPSPEVHPFTVHRQSFQTGAFEFIPLPFVDDWFISRERRDLIAKILTRRGVTFEKEVPKLLADGGAKTLLGRAGGLVKGLVLKPVRKLFRTFFFWITIRRAVLTMVETYFLARFANFNEVTNGADPITQSQAEKWGELFAEVVDKMDRRIAKEGTKRLWQLIRKRGQDDREEVSAEDVESALEEEAPGILADFDQRMRAAMARG
jgi:hypothetical protein